MLPLDSSLELLPKIGKISAAKLAKLELKTIGDLLTFFPFRYDDFTATVKISDLVAGERANVVGTIELLNNKRSPQRRINITEALITDDSGMMKIIWFNQPFIATTLKTGDKVSFSGKVDEDFSGPYLASPVYEKIGTGRPVHTQGLVPNYHLTAGISQKQLRFWLSEALAASGSLSDWLPTQLLQQHGLMGYHEAIAQIHFPLNQDKLAAAKRRLAFDELLVIQYRSQLVKLGQALAKAPAISFQEQATKDFVASLPFTLTTGQRQAAWEILQDMAEPKPMMRLLQGDVGSGKTLVAAIAMLNAALNGYQAAIMAPTEILAKQHYHSLKKVFSDFELSIGLLTAANKLIGQGEQEKKAKAEQIATQAAIVIGTHALLQDKVQFNNLGLVIIDEQHRFGVEQRQTLSAKASGETEAHLLSMTATPIPRTLALSLYDELLVSQITEMPKNRLPIQTTIYQEPERLQAYDRIAAELASGHQAFVICPLIDPTDNLGTKSVKEEYEKLQTDPLFAGAKIGLLHGKLTPKAKNQVMQDFADGQIQLLVATAVVEVGVDVPNATIMLIESAENFGLAQLHQYRGRVGRGASQSYCMLMAGEAGKNGLQRLEALAKFNSGFALAEEDLKFRGPGEVYGLVQKGFPELKIASLFDYPLMAEAQKAAKWLMENATTTTRQILTLKMTDFQKKTHLE
jgi:ATP-dependent DNA helicase RecG